LIIILHISFAVFVACIIHFYKEREQDKTIILEKVYDDNDKFHISQYRKQVTDTGTQTDYEDNYDYSYNNVPPSYPSYHSNQSYNPQISRSYQNSPQIYHTPQPHAPPNQASVLPPYNPNYMTSFSNRY